jgi:hypothetical protein
MGTFAWAQHIGHNVLVTKLAELYDKFKLEICKPTKGIKASQIKVYELIDTV